MDTCYTSLIVQWPIINMALNSILKNLAIIRRCAQSLIKTFRQSMSRSDYKHRTALWNQLQHELYTTEVLMSAKLL